MRFTEASVRDHKPSDGKLNYTVWDDNLPGFGFRVQGGGAKVYYVKYRMGSRQRWLKIGAAEKVSLSAAQKQAKSAFEAVANGVDPADKKAKVVAAAARTMGGAIDTYLDQLKTNKFSAAHIKRSEAYLRRSFKSLHPLALTSIDRASVSRELIQINKRGPIVANRARSVLSAFFNWTIASGLCEANPVDRAIKNQEQTRERVLTAKELKAVWLALDDSNYSNIIRLLILTGQRRTEISGLRWEEINFDEKQIELPASRTKNKRAHIVPLSRAALAILKTIEKDERNTVFPAQHNWQLFKDRLDEKVKIAHWTLHDLRRTAATRMAQDCGIQPHIVEAVLNHVSGSKGGVAGIYNRATYLDEKRDALERYGANALALVS